MHFKPSRTSLKFYKYALYRKKIPNSYSEHCGKKILATEVQQCRDQIETEKISHIPHSG